MSARPAAASRAAAVAEQRAVAILGDQRRVLGSERLDFAFERQRRPRERRIVVAVARDRRGEPVDAFAPRRGDGDAEFRRLALQRVEPMGVARALFEQAVAAAQCALEGGDARAVIGVDRQHQPVEKPAPFARRTDEQPVHGRRQPDEAEVIGEGARRGDRRAVDAVEPLARLVAVARLEADAELMDRAFVLDLDRDRKAAASADPRAGCELGAAQAAAGGEQRQGLEQIGLAGAVLAAEDDQRALQRQVEAHIGAKVAEHQPARHGAPARQGRFGRTRHARRCATSAAGAKEASRLVARRRLS